MIGTSAFSDRTEFSVSIGSFGRVLENAAMGCSRRTGESPGLAVQELAENFLLAERLNGVRGATNIQAAPDFKGSAAIDMELYLWPCHRRDN